MSCYSSHFVFLFCFFPCLYLFFFFLTFIHFEGTKYDLKESIINLAMLPMMQASCWIHCKALIWVFLLIFHQLLGWISIEYVNTNCFKGGWVNLFCRYLPPHTSFLPIDDGAKTLQKEERRTGKRKYVEHLLLSQLSYLVIFVILVCIIEREKMKKDPLNFSVLNITIEIVRWVFICSFSNVMNFDYLKVLSCN